MIPKVRQWKVTFATGSVIYIDAPTRRLALLNTRHEGYYGPIKSIGRTRTQVPVNAHGFGPVVL